MIYHRSLLLQDMAKVEASMIIGALCTRFDISLEPGHVRAR